MLLAFATGRPLILIPDKTEAPLLKSHCIDIWKESTILLVVRSIQTITVLTYKSWLTLQRFLQF